MWLLALRTGRAIRTFARTRATTCVSLSPLFAARLVEGLLALYCGALLQVPSVDTLKKAYRVEKKSAEAHMLRELQHVSQRPARDDGDRIVSFDHSESAAQAAFRGKPGTSLLVANNGHGEPLGLWLVNSTSTQ